MQGGIVSQFWLSYASEDFLSVSCSCFPLRQFENVAVTDEQDPNKYFKVSSIHPRPRVIDNPAAIQQCSNEPDCIQLIHLPPSILALIDIKHSLRLVVLLFINCAALFTNLSPARSISKRRLGGKSCRLTLTGFSLVDSEHQDGSQAS